MHSGSRPFPVILNRLIETDRGPVEYSEAGSGELVLYFHGTGVTGDVMLDVESPLVEDGFRLIIPNRPGYGRTPLAPHGSAAGCADVCAALLDAMGLARVHVMGSSGGAAFAIAFAARHSARTRSLVLLCPQLHRWDERRWLPVTSGRTLPLLRRPFLRRILLTLYRLQLPLMSVKQLMKTEAGGRYNDVAADPATEALCRTTLTAMKQGTKSPGFENDFVVFISEDIPGENSSLEAPTLMIHDEQDPMAPVDHVDWFASMVPDCERVSVHAAGHLIWVGPEADVMHKSRVRFLREHTKGAG